MGTIDLTTDFPFNPSVWIGVGKEFPDSLPLEVLDAKQKTLEIPPAKVLEGLDGAIGQIWLDGGRSITDPRFNDGTERFPLWALSLWNEVKRLIEFLINETSQPPSLGTSSLDCACTRLDTPPKVFELVMRPYPTDPIGLFGVN